MAQRCAEAGARLSICARRSEALAEVQGQLPGQGHGWRPLDVTRLEEIEAVMAGFVEDRGPIDGMVYSAGLATIRPLAALDPSYWEQMIQVNLRGALFCCKAAQRAPRPGLNGLSIALVSSIAGQLPAGSGRIAYAASKAGLDGAMRALAVESARHKLRINSIVAGAVETEIWKTNALTDQQRQSLFEQHPLGIGQVDDVAYACVYLLSPASRWMTGASLVLDGGRSLL